MQFLYCEFAYSTQMQVLLAVITFAETFCTMYIIANIIVTIFGVTLNRKQKILFTVINGTLLQTTLAYAIYIIGGYVSFSPFVYLLIVNVNPIAAAIFYFTALRIFKLSTERSVKLMSYTLILWATKISIGRLLHCLIEAETAAGYNYLLDALQQPLSLVLFYLFYAIVRRTVGRSRSSARFVSNMFFDKKKELSLYFLESVFIFVVSVTFPFLFQDQAAANVVVITILLLYATVSIWRDAMVYYRQVISNQHVHISALFRGMEELRGVKHDFNNILHTYSGYLELKEYGRLERYHMSLVSATSHAGSIMDLAQKMDENPPVISLLISKLEQAEKMNVKLLISLKCSLNNLFIDNMDITRILACLLDNAIGAARGSERQRVCFTIESKVTGSKLVIVTNSMADATAQDPTSDREGFALGLQIVQNIVNKHGNCTFQLEYRVSEMSAYVELREATSLIRFAKG